jgi:hypothetical protein
MKRLTVVISALVAALTSGLLATSAFASLPDFSITLGGGFPLHLKFADNGKTKTKLESTAGGILEGEGLSVLMSVASLTALGTFSLDYLKVTDKSESCHSIGDASGVVLSQGTFHIVYTNLSPLSPALLYELKQFEIECGKTEIIEKGGMISSLDSFEWEAGEETASPGILSMAGSLGGEKGKATIKEYYNDGGTKVKVKLETNVGAGFMESDQTFEGEPALTASEGKKFLLGAAQVVITAIGTAGGIRSWSVTAIGGNELLVGLLVSGGGMVVKNCINVKIPPACVVEIREPPVAAGITVFSHPV